MLFLVCVLFVLFTFGAGLERGSACITPNGENATCMPIPSCRVISSAIAYFDTDAVEFARQSQCGVDGSTPMVCCGSKGHLTTTPSPMQELDNASEDRESNVPIPIRTTSLSPLDNIHLPDHSLCGIQLENTGRIVGGETAAISEFPWMATLKYVKDDGKHGVSFRCGGSLINNKYVVTAAQCLSIKGYNLTQVRLGEWRLSTDRDCAKDEESKEEICADPVEDLNIVQKLTHPYYSKKSGNNDIALLRLERKVKFTDYIRPICLPPPDLAPPPAGTQMSIAGWGITEDGYASDIKLKVIIRMTTNDVCTAVFTNYTHVNPNQACAGGEGGKDACKGDSGGPLMRTYLKKEPLDPEQWYLEGIIYRGLGCGRKGAPSLYTRITRYTSWILNNLK